MKQVKEIIQVSKGKVMAAFGINAPQEKVSFAYSSNEYGDCLDIEIWEEVKESNQEDEIKCKIL